MTGEDQIDPDCVALAWSFEMAKGELGHAPLRVEGLTIAERRMVDALVRLELDVAVAAREAMLEEYVPALLYLRSVAGACEDHATAVASLTPTQELIYSALLPSPPQGPGVGA